MGLRLFLKGGSNMTALMKIQSFIQAYVKAIASILDVDVTIVDNELVQIGRAHV